MEVKVCDIANLSIYLLNQTFDIILISQSIGVCFNVGNISAVTGSKLKMS